MIDQDVANEYHRLKERLKEGVDPMDVGSTSAQVGNGKVLIKGREGRYLVEVSDNQVNILGVGARGNKKNLLNFRDLMNGKYKTKIKYEGKNR